MQVGVIDYKAGNLRSVETALKYLGASFTVGDEPEQLGAVDKLIFPGVGDAKAAMDVLDQTGFSDYIREFAATGKPLLGICVGSQIVLDSSEERSAQCLGLVPGVARRFPDSAGLKIPQIGWNTVSVVRNSPLLHGIPAEASFYFVHSYYPDPASDDAVIGTTDYGVSFASVLGQDNLTAVQFHPEKSGPWGLKLLQNFLERGE